MTRTAGTKRARVSPRQLETTPQIPSGEIPELHNRIAVRAYEIFEQRGRADGHDWEDWFRAEQEVLSDGLDSDLG